MLKWEKWDPTYSSSTRRDKVWDDMSLRSLGIDSITVLSMIARVMKEERIDPLLAASALSDMANLGKMQTVNDLDPMHDPTMPAGLPIPDYIRRTDSL